MKLKGKQLEKQLLRKEMTTVIFRKIFSTTKNKRREKKRARGAQGPRGGGAEAPRKRRGRAAPQE